MKAEELRIGNWVYDTSDPHQKIETQWTFKDFEMSYFSLDGNTADFYRLGFEPIPLTSEWLEKFGFSRINDRFIKGKFTYNIHNGWWFGNKRLPNKRLQYVHQLQNLFYCLIGKEL